MNLIPSGRHLCLIAFLLIGAGVSPGADESGVKAMLQSPSQRKPAPVFALKDSPGKVASVKDYRGKILLLDFWATWCHGCTQEMPWFVAFHRKYASKGLSVVGVSLDGYGWKAV